MQTIENLEKRLAELEGQLDCERSFKDIALWAGECRVLAHDAIALAKSLQVRLAAVMPVFEEARDAITVITVDQCKLRGISLDLADRMDDVGIPDRWAARTAAIAAQKGEETK